MSNTLRALALGVTCLSVMSVAPVQGATPGHGLTTLSRLPKGHTLDASPAIANLRSTPAGAAVAQTLPFLVRDDASAATLAIASDGPSHETAASMTQTTAASAARDVAGAAATCDAYFTTSQNLAPYLTAAYPAMASRDITTLSNQLPALDRQLAALPAAEIAPEICAGNHVNAYTSYQFFELSALRARGLDNGFAITLPIVKQPDLNQGTLAYVVGWTKFEKADYVGALSAYAKGLSMFPHDHALQNEYVATLMKLDRGAEIVSFTENVLFQTYDLDDATRAKLYMARAVGQIMVGQLDAADSSFTVSLLYAYTDETKAFQDQLRAARAKK